MCRHAESQLDVHTAGVALDRGIDKIAHLGKFDDLVHFGIDLGAGHAQDGAIEIDVFPAGHFRVETGANLQHGGYPAVDINIALGGGSNVGKQFKQCGFTRTVGTDDAHRFAFVYVKADTIQGHKGGTDQTLVGADDGVGVLFAALAGPPALQVAAQRTAADLADLILFLDTADADHDIVLFCHDSHLLTRYLQRSFRPC